MLLFLNHRFIMTNIKQNGKDPYAPFRLGREDVENAVQWIDT